MRKNFSLSIFILIFIFTFYLFSKYTYKKLEFSTNNTLKIILIKKDKPLINEKRVFEINLSENIIKFYENNSLKEKFKIAYQSPEGVWYQTPTGYFRVGIKKEKAKSSLFSVYFNYAVQFYEDFFIHGIPYYSNGEKVNSQFTGGCLRLEDNDAKRFYELAQKGDLIIIYKTLNDFKLNNNFSFPVNVKEYLIIQRFNNPIRTRFTNSLDRKLDYIQHAGIDLIPNPNAEDFEVRSIYDGKIIKIIKNGQDDHGLGNTIIIEHNINTSTIYSLYAHLSEINKFLKEGDFVKKGEKIGKIGATGYGCDYWRIGEDGCDKEGKLNIHLHFEIKTKPVLESPIPTKCYINNEYKKCYGYVPDDPEKFGYINPMKFLLYQ